VSGGDQALAVIATVRNRKRSPAYKEALVLMRVGKTMEILDVGANSLSPGTVRKLATLMARRAETGLAQQ
jgi:hypothetical protein